MRLLFTPRRSIIYKYFLIYTIICLVVVALLTPVYYTTLNTAYDNSVKEIDNMIKESSKRLERSIEHVIQLNNNINNMLYAEVKNLSSTNISTVQYYKLIQVCKDLKLLSNNIEFVSLFYIIFNKHNKVITNGKIYD